MGLGQTLILGLIAGVTIVFGLPVGRMRRPAPNLRLMLNAIAVGILLFLVWDVLSAAYEPIDTALGHLHDHTGGLGPVFGYAILFGIGLTAGLMSLVYYERSLGSRVARRRAGPGAMTAGELDTRRSGVATWAPARRLALMIAIGIGLHNFAEGLAIGGSAGSGDISLAVLLVIGFGLHNATEGFGITAPLSADTEAERPSWPFLLTLGLIGGGPTFLGTLLGHSVTSEPVSVVFLTLAAGSILYVVIQLIGVGSKVGRRDLLAWGILIGLMAGFVTDFIVTAAGV
jgi:zinc transporter, ZIP family